MVNNLGIDPNEWFDNPLDKMPIAKNPPDWEDTAPSEYEPPDEKFPAELLETPTSVENPDLSDEIEKEKSIHQKMYEIATSKYNPFAVGGSESLGGGSEQVHK